MLSMGNTGVVWDSNKSISSTYTSANFLIPNVFGYSVQFNITGASLSGTMSLQTSLDGVNFSTLPSATSTISTLTGTTSIFFLVSDPWYPLFQATFVPSAGTGTLNQFLVYTKGQ